MEPRITEIGENLIRQLADNDKEIEAIMARISDDEVRATHNFNCLSLYLILIV